ncbi:MAG: hypothetical protein NTX24_05290 [Candidatus Pacearchaeota archaeon]|nr:hypothetical protein [Candidatus Pacearchaeota archaeon]
MNQKKSKLTLLSLLAGACLLFGSAIGIGIGGSFVSSPDCSLKVYRTPKGSIDTLRTKTNSRGRWVVGTENMEPDPQPGETLHVLGGWNLNGKAKTFDVLVSSPPPYLDLHLNKHTACIKNVYDQTNFSGNLNSISWIGNYAPETTAVDTGLSLYWYYDVHSKFDTLQATHGSPAHIRLEKMKGDTTFFRNLDFTVDTTRTDAQLVKDTAYFTRDSFVVNQTPIWDFGASRIIAPTGSADSGEVITPGAWIKNYGNQASGGNARMKIGSNYSRDTLFNLIQPGESTSVSFSDWIPLIRGNNAVKCSTMVSGDTSHQNDYKTSNTFVNVFDARPVSIDSPVGAIPKSQPVNPKATLENTGNVSIDSIVGKFFIFRNNPDSLVYSARAMVENLSPNQKLQLSFSPWKPDTLGPHSCSLHMTAYKGGSAKDEYLINGPRQTKVEIPDNFLLKKGKDILNPEPNQGYLERKKSRR